MQRLLSETRFFRAVFAKGVGLKLWDLTADRTGGNEPLQREERSFTAVVFSPNGKFLASASGDEEGDRVVRVCDVATRKTVREWKIE